MALISQEAYVPRRANRRVPTQIGAGSGYVGAHRRQEPDWFGVLLDDAMRADRFREACGLPTDSGRR